MCDARALRSRVSYSPLMSAKQRAAAGVDEAEQALRNEEVLRANRELAAYFKGRRTEREARAALKIIKAFIRDRERTDPASLAPLPAAKAPRKTRTSPPSDDSVV